jgi:replication factor A1
MKLNILGKNYPARLFTQKDIETFKYIIFIACKNDIDPLHLLHSIIEARERKFAKHGPLKIIQRERTKDYTIFMLRKNNIIAQFKLRDILLHHPRLEEKFSELVAEVQIHALNSLNKKRKTINTIKELRIGMCNVSFKGYVTYKSEIIPRHSRYNGHILRLSIAILTDESGSIRLSLWDDRIKAVEVGDEVEVIDASVKGFHGMPYIKMKKNSRLNVHSHNIPFSNALKNQN